MRFALIAFSMVLSSCVPKQAPEPCPTPEATTTPAEQKELSGNFILPRESIVYAPIVAILCEPLQYNIKLVADGKYELGTFGYNQESGCMELVFRMNTAGTREISIQGEKLQGVYSSRKIFVSERKSFEESSEAATPDPEETLSIEPVEPAEESE